MVVALAHIDIELPESYSLKDKRREIKSLMTKTRTKFAVSIAEVELHESVKFASLGIAHVSNSKKFGISVLQKSIDFIEENLSGSIHNYEIHAELY